jgi:signal transduction histidine kinase
VTSIEAELSPGGSAYNHVMTAPRSQSPVLTLYLVASYITMLGVSVVMVPGLSSPSAQGLATLGLLLFAALLVPLVRSHRRRRIRTLFATLVLIAFAIFAIEPSHMLDVQTLFFVLVAALGVLLPLREALIWALGIALLSSLAGLSVLGWERWPAMIASSGAFVFFAAFGSLFRRADAARHRSVELLGELREANDRLKRYAVQERQLAVAEERNRMAREMHDALGHRLTVAVVQLEGAERLIESDPERARGMIHSMRSELKTGLAELRETVAALRQPHSDPLDARLQRLASGFEEATGLKLDLRLPPQLPELSVPVQHALYRATQEGLTNIQKHAGAERIEVALVRRGSELELTVSDDGAGPTPPPNAADDDGNSYGLQGLRERAGKLGGRATLEAPPEGGSRLVVTLPLEAGAPGDV